MLIKQDLFFTNFIFFLVFFFFFLGGGGGGGRGGGNAVCSAQSGNLRNLKIALRILRILRLHSNLEIVQYSCAISRLRKLHTRG